MTMPSRESRPAAGTPRPPHGHSFAAGPPPGPPARVNKKSPVRRVVIGLVVVAVIAVLAFIGRLVTDNPDVAGTGDCLSGGSAAELKVVDCADAGAEYKVVGKVDGKSQADFRTGGASFCRPFQGATRAFWKGTVGGNGYILCLTPNN
jgi:hypothetical protein